ncbi:uncharacterized protein B0I36DRAFT_90000 [Microdochium trichocladiopsis]|uniref:Zn(2)-C6 fungal-type domain-containing protein n=1 Tax=Microdochium trichocladiopsis TaxID=1682393 RepID=A0A9P8YBI9_9PEZI|nr:uncharacterized protein B0I36DRAFT_90000 [Microdochium trichocladiopsis]KAH7035242.1 hypothetical protein B0I36DRAFT_90000 [Microdochium trichocladiopsis]
MSRKRTWSEARLEQEPRISTPSTSHRSAEHEALTSPSHGQRRPQSDESPAQPHVPVISRKVKACAACRKHKIKCIMDSSGPPCRRCTEKGLGCVLNKSLQTLISERNQFSESIIRDMEMMHSSLQTVLKTLNLPPVAPLETVRNEQHSPISEEPLQFEKGPSCDNSPKAHPVDDNELPNVPIQSVYHLTKLSALRSPDSLRQESTPKSDTIDDFISKGQLPLADAERLFLLYKDKLDHYLYHITTSIKSLEQARRRSRILTVSMLTVAALHDPQGNANYGVCSQEFRRVMAGSIFSRRIDRDYLRAMCIASYWLSDISWMISGYAIRRAAEFNLQGYYRRAIAEPDEEAIDFVRIWYALYICDQHLSTLFSRQSVIREDSTIQGWQEVIKAPLANGQDVRLASQVVILDILRSIRDLFGPDTGETVPQVYLMQISAFARQIDQYVGHWSTALKDIGTYPRKGALLHFHFGKLYLYSHVFRGLRDATIPAHFRECATHAVHSATAIINLHLNDADIKEAISGLPTYIHSMTGFACMFLAKLAMTQGDDMIERSTVTDLITRLISLYRAQSVSKWHLIKLMAGGLDKVVQTLSTSEPPSPTKKRAQLTQQQNAMKKGNFEALSAVMLPQTDQQQAQQGQNHRQNKQAHSQPTPRGAGLLSQDQQIPPDLDLGLEGFGGFSEGDASLLGLDSNFLLGYDMSLGPEQLMYLSNGHSSFDTDLSPTFL